MQEHLSENFKDNILNSIAEGVLTVDKNFKITYFNKAAENITGFKSENVIGKFCKSVFEGHRCSENCPIAHVLEKKNQIVGGFSNICTKNGREIPIKINVNILYNKQHEPSGGIVTFRDISDLELLQKELTEKTSFHGIVGISKSMQDIFHLIEEISDSPAPVLISGESGTGKEMIADAIQKLSNRSNKPFVKINCSVFPEDLLASELFGHVKGAFTDAHKDREGRFELADQGTIFLDEVAETPLSTQIKLLRVIQEGVFERVGESKPRSVDVRIISATNLNIENALKTKVFREDLFYRLSVIPIEVPPLRERKEDIIPLMKYFFRKYSLLYNKVITEIEDDALDMLLNHSWQGNIRELENAVEYSVVRTEPNSKISIEKLPPSIRQKSFSNSNYKFQISDNEEARIISALLQKHKWNKTEVAKEMGIGRTTLWRKMKIHELV